KFTSVVNGLSDVQDFGRAVAVEDGIVLVGAEADSGAARAAGAVYAFAALADGWRQTHRIAPDDPDELGLFGASVALRLPFLVVGAYADDDLALGAGAALPQRPGRPQRSTRGRRASARNIVGSRTHLRSRPRRGAYAHPGAEGGAL